MEVIGSINLYNDTCIDTLQQDYTIIQNYSPIDIAVKWNNIGVNRIHLVDVNGLMESNPNNLKIIKEIIQKVKVPTQVALGVDNFELIEDMLATGASRIILDNRILKNSDFVSRVLKKYPEKTIIVFNVDSGRTEINENYHDNVIDIINELKKQGLKRVIYHDISLNYEFNYDDLINITKNVQIPVIACGKLNDPKSLKKIRQLAGCENKNIEGIILSKSLYDSTLNLYEVIKLLGAYPYIGDFYSREDIC